jgi:hypothetical protein
MKQIVFDKVALEQLGIISTRMIMFFEFLR